MGNGDKPPLPPERQAPLQTLEAGAVAQPPTPDAVRRSREVMKPSGGVDHIVGTATVGVGNADAPVHSKPFMEAVDQAIRAQLNMHRGNTRPQTDQFDSLPEDQKNRMRQNLMRFSEDLSLEPQNRGEAIFQGHLMGAHERITQNPNAPLEERMQSAMALSRANPKDTILLDAQKKQWDGMTPEKQKAAIDEAMSTPPEQRAKAIEQARREGRYTGMLEISPETLGRFAIAADPTKEATIRQEREGLRTDERSKTVDTLQQQLVDSMRTPEARETSKKVVDEIKQKLVGEKGSDLRPLAPGPKVYESLAHDYRQKAESEKDGQKAATMRGAAKILTDSARQLGGREQTSEEGIRRSGEGDPLAGAEATGTGERRQTSEAQTRLALERVNKMGYEEIAAKARNPEEFRKELGIELPRERAERERLMERFRGSKLMSAGLAADWIAGIFGL